MLKLQAQERADVALLFCFSLASVGGTVTIGRSVGRVLFVAGLPAELVPYRFVLSAIGIVGAILLYSACQRRLSLGWLIGGSQIVLFAGTLLLRLLVGTSLGGSLLVLGALFTWLEIAAALVNTQFWVIAGQIFDPRSARRVFGLIAAGGPIGNLAAGFVLTVLAGFVPAQDLLFLLAACLAGCAACVRALAQRHPEVFAAGLPAKKTGQNQRRAESLPRSIGRIVRTPLIATIVAILLVMTFATNIADYQLDLALKVQYAGDAQAMSAFLGEFYFVGGAIAFLLQVFVTGRLLQRYGLQAALAMQPIAIALASVAALATAGALASVTAVRAADFLFRFTITDTALNMLYLPIASEPRRRAKELVEGLFKPVAIVGLSLAFLVLRASGLMHLQHWSWVTLVLGALWLVLIGRAVMLYRTELANGLRARRLNLDADMSLGASDPATYATLRAALHGSDPELAASALHVIENAPDKAWGKEVGALLGHPSAELRAAAATFLGQRRSGDFVDLLVDRLENAEDDERTAMAAALGAIATPPALTALRPLLDDPHPAVQRAAISGLLRHGEVETTAVALPALDALLASSSRANRVAAAEILGEVARPDLQDRLLPLLEDASDKVQAAALSALARHGDAVVPLLTSLLGDGAGGRAARLKIPDILSQVGSSAAAQALGGMLSVADSALRGRVYRAMVRLAESGVAAASPEPLREQLRAEIQEAYRLCALWADLGDSRSAGLLGDAVEHRVAESRERVLMLLRILKPGDLLAAAQRGLASPDARRRDNALELLDNTVGRAVRTDILPLFEASLAEVAELAHARFGLARRSAEEHLGDLARGTDRWLRLCALHHIGALQLTSLGGALDEGAIGGDALVRETAIGAMERLQQLQPNPGLAMAGTRP